MMKNFKSKFIKCLKFFTFIILGVYLIYLFVLPPVFSSRIFKNKYDDFVYAKTGVKIKSEHLKVKTHPDLSVDIIADRINLDTDSEDLVQAKNIDVTFNPLKKDIKKLNIDYIY